MARVDTLTNYLSDVADEIKTKKGDDTPILASEFDTEIANLPNIVHPNYVSFRGYTGNVLDISWLRTDNMTSFSNMFDGCNKITSIDVSNFDATNITSTTKMFNGCSLLETILGNKKLVKSSNTNISNMYSNCPKLLSLDLSEWDTTGLTNIGNAFSKCSNLTSIIFPSTSVASEITNSNYLFQQCTSLTELDLTTFLNTTHTSNSNAEGMFDGCTSLQTIKIPNFKLSSSFNTWRYAFRNCTSLEYLDVRSVNFAGINNIAQSFLNVPNNCLILVKDTASKNAILTKFSNLTNIQIASQYEANN